MRGHHGRTIDGMAEECQGDAVGPNVGVWMSRLYVRGRKIVLAPDQTDIAVRQQSGKHRVRDRFDIFYIIYLLIHRF